MLAQTIAGESTIGLATTPAAVDRGRPRLWVDRVFAAKGSGTVVTGTLAGGSLAVDDELVVLAVSEAVDEEFVDGEFVVDGAPLDGDL